MKQSSRRFTLIALLLLATCADAWAQLATAQMNGRVTDESGAVLPGVTITVTHTDTGATRTVVTDDSGAYVLPNLPTGPYRLEAMLSGFRSYAQTGIVLQVASAPVINIALALGNLEETVTVDAAAPLVDVKSAGIGTVIENERIVELPLQGRQVTDLILLAGAAVQTGQPNTRSFQGGVNIAVAGGQGFGVAYLLDGAMHNDPSTAAGLPLPFPDALQEFRLATSGLSAENGIHSGASVNAVTKSGTNRFHGNGFEFYRDKRFNATNVFAPIGPDGKRLDDGLHRNQFGGTLGGPIVPNRLFFFGGYQRTQLRQQPNANIGYVPTAAMLAGDFTAFASAACNSGGQVTLRAPFAGNRVDPTLFSPAALKLVPSLPKTTDPCGEVRFPFGGGENIQAQTVARVDFQRTANDSIFIRYMATTIDQDIPDFDNILSAMNPATIGLDNLSQAVVFGDSRVFGSNTVNSLRVAYNRTRALRLNRPAIGPEDLGIGPFYNYEPHRMALNIIGGFTFGTNAGSSRALSQTYQVTDDLTLVRGNHQIAIGGTFAYWNTYIRNCTRCGGQFEFNGQVTGLGLADFLLGKVLWMEQAGAGGVDPEQHYVGLFATDAWRVTNRLTVNAGLRWEPFFGQEMGYSGEFGTPIWSWDNFRSGVQSRTFVNAPPGLLYAGDPGFPKGRSGMHDQWLNLSPRAGVAWDVSGNGRMALRASYALTYDFPTGDMQILQTSAAPFGNRVRVDLPPGGFDNPYSAIGGNPHPIATSRDTVFPPAGTFGVMAPEINSPRAQSWNVTLERQMGANWGFSVSYLGNHSDRLWDLVPLNPAVFMGTGPCTLPNGVFYPVCSTTANTNDRRVISLENPTVGRQISNLEVFDDYGVSNYRALQFSARRVSPNGVSLNGNYTWSYCFGDRMADGNHQFASGPTKPDDLAFDQGNCTQNRTHIANLTVGYQTPRFAGMPLRIVASDWRVSGILTASSGPWLTVFTGRDNALNGQLGTINQMTGQRANQISDDVYGQKTVNQYLNPAAFTQPAPGTFGNHVRGSITGPGQWVINTAVSRMLTLLGTQNVEFRVEAFNLLNHFNWGLPATNLQQGTFGRITSQATDPRILQFGVKYGF
jgi:Carboxypeptidase regulatory-like domain